MKKHLILSLLLTSGIAFADNSPQNNNMATASTAANTTTANPNLNSANNQHSSTDMSGMSMADMNMANMMYMDFGVGIGTASNWSSTSLALDAMTMGFYYKPGLGVEIGMGMLPNGNYQGNGAMINTYHLAAKGILPLAEVFSLYGKLGLGISSGQGNATGTVPMGMGMTMPSMTMITPTNAGLYYAVGAQFNLSKRFGLYLENSGIAVVPSGNDGGFGNVNQTTIGLEIRM